MTIFNEIINHIKSFSFQKYDGERYRSSLNIFEDKYFTIKFIDSILNDICLKKEIITQSYIHHNGFGKLILSNNFDLDWRLRLHIWWRDLKEFTIDDYDIHDHTWDFSSIVLFGKLRNEIYKEVNSGDGGESFIKHIYTIPLSSNEATMIVKGRANLKIVESNEYSRGQSYFQTKEKLHRAFPIENNAVTLVIQEIGKGPTSNVYKKKIHTYEKSKGLSGHLLTASELDKILTEVLNWLREDAK